MWPWKPNLPPDIGGSSSNSGPPEGMRKISDSVYSLYEPPGPPEIEIVFVHGVQLSDYKEAHWRTWTAGEDDKHGKQICWPMAWLPEEFPRARILSLQYDLCHLSMVGEALVQEMVELANVGQHENCPVVFVCHCVGGLVAKQIVIQAHRRFGGVMKYGKFLQNISGFYFYATPHDGSKLADLAAQLPSMSLKMVDSLKVLNKETGRLNNEFERLERDHFMGRWQFWVVAETCATSMYGFSAKVVAEASAGHGYKTLYVSALDHFGVCKPSNVRNSTYLFLTQFLQSVEDHNKYETPPDSFKIKENKVQDMDVRPSNSGPLEGIIQLTESVYSLYEPPGPPEIEIVFVHGVQLSDYNEAHWRTWTAGEDDKHGKQICWPMAWLPEEFPRARILSLQYDLCHLSMVGEALVQEMVELANVGQHENCPVVFVCHCVGGLVAKQIVIQAHRRFGGVMKYGKFLQNISGFYFYATPHDGSKLADLAAHLPSMSLKMVDSLKVLNKETGRLNSEFERLAGDHFMGRWRFGVVAETCATSMYGFSAKVVEEASARHGYKTLCVSADHFGVCKPSDKAQRSYLVLKSFLASVVAEDNLRRNSLFVLPSYMVGMDSRAKGVCKKLEQHSVVALIGMGGVGKTTLSKYVFSVEVANFEKYCFLGNVKSHKNVESCQRQLFNALCDGRWNENESVNFHMGKVKECILSKKVLLVVDDVGDEVNMTALQVPVFNDGNSGSKVIVTTRRRDILEDLVNEGAIVPVDFLSEEEALDLFSYYAFSGVEESVSEEFFGLAKKIIEACGNLPLSLEVIGQFLRSKWTDTSCESIEKQRDVWDQVLLRLREANFLDVNSADNILWARMMISFEGLSKDEQSIFLDMACILCRSWSLKKGQWSMMLHRDTLEQIWNSIDIQNLTSRSFIKWSDDNTLLIHDQLQDMARAFVMGEVDENKSRVWESEEGLNFMLQERVSKTLEGLSLGGVDELSPQFEKLKEIVESLNLREAEHFDHLRLLNLFNCGAEVVQYYIELGTNELRWAALNGSSVKESHIQGLGYLRGLQVLNMQGCKLLETLPISIQSLSLLAVLDLSYCEGLRSLRESICALPKLQVLNLYGCISLETLPESIGELSLLMKLDLSFCNKLKSLPESIGKLQKLQQLMLHNCISLETLPEYIGELSLLMKLDLSFCNKLKSLPESIGKLQKLQELMLHKCVSLEILPESVGKLSLLTTFTIFECYKLKILPSFTDAMLKSLRLDFSHCYTIQRLPASIGKFSLLTTLDLSYCKELRTLPRSTAKLRKLQVLRLFSCENLETLPKGIVKLSLITTLDLSYCKRLKNLPDSIGKLLKLKVLILNNCDSLKTLPASIGKLSVLTRLDLSYCEELKILPESIGGLTELKVLELTYCSSLEGLPTSIGNLSHLTNLNLTGCYDLKHLPDSIGEMIKLQVLEFFQCVPLEKLPNSIGKLSLLTTLNLDECHKLKTLPDSIGGLQNLQKMRLSGYSLEKLPASIGDLSLLFELDLQSCIILKELPESIGRLQNLQVLNLNRCKALQTLPTSVSNLPLLKEVDGYGCQESLLQCIDRLKLPALKEHHEALLASGSGRDMDCGVGDVEEKKGRKPWCESMHYYNYRVMFSILLEPLSNTVGFLTNYGCFVFGLLLQLVRIPTGTSGQQVPSPYKSRVKSKDLTLDRFLGQGYTGMLYETAWSRSQENTGRLARKLFPDVKGDVFESEVVRLFGLTDHPNIVKIFCWTVDNRSCSLIMEFVSDNLSDIVRKKTEARRKEAASKQIVIGTTRSGPFQFPEALQIVAQIAKGIRHLHDHDIYHGDLKPNNVLIDGEIDPMSVKLADFGLVKTKRRTTLVSQRTLCSHMIAWRAPEIVEDYISSMSDDLDYLGVELDIQDSSSVLHDKVRTKVSMEKADTYSFALLCAYVLGGKVWDANLSSNELRKQTSRFGLRPKLPSECPEALASLISLCWDADPKRRPTFSIICDKLEKIVKDHQREKKGKYPPEQPEETVRQRARPVEGKFDA
ncbi:hypothetical protein M758_11G064500 [Ceratodon purpureus]|nr:hypothetical protein M758_11G064500 [Ceratodon purpureus]